MPVPHNSSLQGNLPMPLSSFVGREQEIADVKAQLAAHRLVTLIGPGGVGKTRLALAVAHHSGMDYPGGRWLVELAPLAAGRLVAQAVASALGLREDTGQSVNELLTNHLLNRIAFLLLDNCEHLVEASATLSASLLVACPNIRILATSREPLGVPGEVVWIVPPLTLPAPQPWRNPDHEQRSIVAYQQSEAIQLFAARAVSTSPNFKLTAENGPWVAEICRRLDGLPLAIELAAAKVRTFSPRQIAERLDDRFRLLSGRLHTAPARQQTLASTLDWSYELLSESERQLLQLLAVFNDGWTLDAADAIFTDELAPSGASMPLLSNLVDKSWIVVDDSSEHHRYYLLETIRQYALHKLTEAGKVALARDRHLSYFCQWAEMASAHLSGSEQPKWLARFEAEHDNLRAALDWSQGSEARATTGLRLATACGFFWRLHGYLSEGREHLSQALAQEEAHKDSKTRSLALLRAAHLAYLQSDYDACDHLAHTALDVSQQLGTAGRIEWAHALDLLAKVAIETGNYEQAQKYLEGALQIYRGLDNGRGIAKTLMQLGGWAMRGGHYEKADSYLTQSLTYCRNLSEIFLTASVLSVLGELDLRRGQYNLAMARLQESLTLRQSLDDHLGIAATLGNLAWATLLQSDYQRTRQLLQESLAIRLEIGDQGGIAWCLEKSAETLILEASLLPNALRKQVGARAVLIFAAATALRTPLKSVIDPADRPTYDQTLQTLRISLGQERFAAAWAKGEGLPLTKVVTLALEPALSPSEMATLSQAKADKVKFGGLSARERETAALIAQGKTNREIAKIMVVREKTIETYVTRILNKLGFDSRVQIATWAITIGLTELNGESD